MRTARRSFEFKASMAFDQDAADRKIALLQIDDQLAKTAAQRQKIELQILDIQIDIQRKALEEQRNRTTDTREKARYQAAIDALPTAKAKQQQYIIHNTMSPGQQLLDSLDPAKINEELQSVEVDGLKGLEDGLTGIIDGTKSIKSAFKDMTQSIIADLARIAIEQEIIKPLANSLFGGTGFLSGIFGHADGGEIQGHAGGGRISGAGGPRSDDILSWLSNGEFVVNADATSKNLALLTAINDNKMPHFAAGGAVMPIRSPRLPDLSQVAAARGTTVQQNFDLRGAMIDKDVYADMHRIAAQHAGSAAAKAYAGAMRDAPAEISRRAGRRLGR